LENVETFGIDPKELAHTVQVAMACSSTLSPIAQKNKGVQIVIQGNQINYVVDLKLDIHLISTYGDNGVTGQL
jgi:translation initiation factor 1 (eIF-1/SUI1)